MKRVNSSQKSVAATQVQVRVISSRFDLSDVPGKIKGKKHLKNDLQSKGILCFFAIKVKY